MNMLAYEKLTRDEVRQITYQVIALGVDLSLKNGRVAARPRDGQPMPIEALVLLKTYRDELLEYLTTPPVETRPCAACGRVNVWTLCPMGVWVCDCYYHAELRTWPDVQGAARSTGGKVVDWRSGHIVAP